MSGALSDVVSLARTPSIGMHSQKTRSSMSSNHTLDPLPEFSLSSLYTSLKNALNKSQDRALTKSAQWAAKLLISLTPNRQQDNRKKTFKEDSLAYTGDMELENELDSEDDMCMLSRLYFDTCEYERAAQLLEGYGSNKALFLRHYALYMEDPLKVPPGTNKSFFNISESLSKYKNLDGYSTYLHGFIKSKMGNKEEALELLLKSVALEPYNWSAWDEMCSLIMTSTQMERVLSRLHPGLMRSFFILNLASNHEIYHNDVEKELERLKSIFPDNAYLELQEATLYYKQTLYERSLELFEKYRSKEPYSLDCADYESNMLFVLEDIQKLGTLSRNTFSIDRYRYESCVAVGNYFCLRRDHLKAIKYFERALKLKPRYTDVYIMIGHEYLEEKNINAAMEAYRCATETSPDDFRGWYGMGHTLASIEQLSEALVYFQNAATRQQEDARPWTQLGYLYQRMGIPLLASQCWRRALSCINADNVVYYNLGSLYAFEKSDFQNEKIAAVYFRRFLSGLTTIENSSSSIISSKTYLSAYYLECRDFKNCIKYLRDITDTQHGSVLLSELSHILSINRNGIDENSLNTYLEMIYKINDTSSLSNDMNIECDIKNLDTPASLHNDPKAKTGSSSFSSSPI